jgi:hypothetical protein
MPGTQIQSLRMLGPFDGVPSSDMYWPLIVSVRPSLSFLWATLTPLAGFVLVP